jgi:hypothetical protein
MIVICRNAPAALSSPFPLQQILELQMMHDDVLTNVGRVWNFSPKLGQVSAGSLTQNWRSVPSGGISTEMILIHQGINLVGTSSFRTRLLKKKLIFILRKLY